MSEEKQAMERRTFLCVVGAAGAVAAGAPGCGNASPSTDPFSAGRVADHPMGVWKLYGAQSVIVGRDAGGYYAFSAICTHESNTLEFREPSACTAPTGCTSISMTGLTRCPVHFSRFDANGAVIVGPAAAPLPPMPVTAA